MFERSFIAPFVFNHATRPLLVLGQREGLSQHRRNKDPSDTKIPTFNNKSTKTIMSNEKSKQQQLSKHGDETSEDSPSSVVFQAGMPHDILTLDIGGEGTIRVSRHTLTQFKDSLLAAKFGRWKDEPQLDGTIYINQSMRLFKPLIDFLRDKENAPPGTVIFPPAAANFAPGDDTIFPAFLRMVDHFGLMKHIYPFWVMTISPSTSRYRECHLHQRGGIHARNHSGRGSYSYIKTINPDYRIKSFRVDIDATSSAGEQLYGGFLHGDPPKDYLDPEKIKATKILLPKVRDGDVLLFTWQGCKHFINDPASSAIIETRHFGIPAKPSEHTLIPFFGGKGAWCFGNVSLKEETFECNGEEELQVIENEDSDDETASETHSQAESHEESS